MLKIVYRICCGMDVHKSFVVACIASTNENGVTTYKSKRFSTFTGDLRRCADWLSENNCKDVCMESTGKYWIPVYNILEPTCNIVLAHPKYVKAIRGKKTDKRDAKWIADICKHDLESLILSTIEKYLPKLGLVMTAPGIQSFAAVGIIFEIGSVVFHI